MRADVAALRGMGFTVFPCSPTKQPRVQKGHDWRTPTEYMWREDDLIGVSVPLGTVVLDIDNMDLFKEQGLPLPPESIYSLTRRDGGAHLYYRVPEGVEAEQVAAGRTLGYDTRVGGLGYVIAWNPSDWRPYQTWPIAPEWLTKAPVRAASVAEPIPEVLSSDADIMRALGKLISDSAHRFTVAELVAIQKSWLSSGTIVSVDPKWPWSERDFLRHAESAVKWEPGTGMSANIEVAPPLPTDLTRIRNIVDYLRDVPDVIPWVIGKVAFTHGLTLLAGSPKAGKSTAAFEMMRCRETGERFLDQLVYPGPTLLVTEEGGVSVKFKGSGLSQLDVYDRKASQGEKFSATLEVVGDWASKNPGGVIFLDTLAAWAQVEDENDSAEMQEAIDAIRLGVSEPYEVAVVLIHHARKGGGSYGEGIRGSGAILAAVDHVMELTRPAGSKRPNRRNMDIMSRVLHEFERWTFDWDGDAQRYTVVTAADEDSEAEEDLMADYEQMERDVAAIPSDGEGITEAETGLSWKRLNVLVNRGRVRKQPGAGRRPNLYWGIPPVGAD